MKGKRKIKKVKGSIEKFCTDYRLIKQTIENAVSLKPNAVLKYLEHSVAINTCKQENILMSTYDR